MIDFFFLSWTNRTEEEDENIRTDRIRELFPSQYKIIIDKFKKDSKKNRQPDKPTDWMTDRQENKESLQYDTNHSLMCEDDIWGERLSKSFWKNIFFTFKRKKQNGPVTDRLGKWRTIKYRTIKNRDAVNEIHGAASLLKKN